MEYPQDEISNRELRVKLYLPDTQKGYYRGTRFDWSGVIYGLRYRGHDYYGPWYTRTDPGVHDFVYTGPDIVAGPAAPFPALSRSSMPWATTRLPPEALS
jgi:hypothetical protein